MEKFSKKTLLNYVNGAGLYGAIPTGSSVVKFAWASTLKKIGTGGDGTITFYADSTNGSGLVLVGDQIVSSKIMDLAWAQSEAEGAKTGEKVVTLKYISGLGESAELNTVTLDVIDKAAAKAIIEDYFKTSNTIDVSNGVANVRVDGTTILVDSINGLKSGLKIAYVAEHDSVGAQIQLQDKDGNVQGDAIEVSDIVGDGILKDSVYHQDTNVLELRFGNGKTYSAQDPTTYTVVNVDLQKLIDINDVFIGDDSSIYLHATLSESTVTIDTKMQDPSTATADATGLADAWKVKQYVESKTTALAVEAEGDNYVDATVDAVNNKKINVAATDKTKTAVALAETAVQSVVEGTSVERYVALNISAKSDTSVITITTDDSALSAKLAEADASIDALQAKDEEIDASINRLDTSVSAIETAIADMDADLSDNTLNGSIGITLKEENGKVTAIDITATEAETTFTPASEHIQASLESTSGILTGSAIEDIVAYVNAKSSDLDSSVTGKDTKEFVIVNTVQTDGALSAENVTVVYGDYNDPQIDGIATTSATKTYVDTKIQSLDLANDVADASAVDGAGFVKTVISETDGIVKNESVTVTYGDYSTHANGIAKTADTSVFVEKQITAALTWQVLN